MRLENIGITYRQFEKQFVVGLGDVNVFVGANNSGKTTLFRAVQRLMTEGSFIGPDTVFVDVRVTPPRAHVGETFFRFSVMGGYKLRCTDLLHRNLSASWSGVPDEYETGFKIVTLPNRQLSDWLKSWVAKVGGRFKRFNQSWRTNCYYLWHRRKSSYDNAVEHCASLDPEAGNLAARINQLLSEKATDIDEPLTRFMNHVIPGIGSPRTRWRDVKGTPHVKIVFESGGRETPLEHLGGGVEQVLAIATVLLGEVDDGGLFLEEPEAHLHQSAQRRLVEQIIKFRGQRQLFISTHSPVFINGFGPESRVYRVRHNNQRAVIEPCITSGEQREVLDDLGVLPSSLLQTNAVIWVEGPTESVLIRHWLSLVAPDLSEHVHYEFVYTAGSILQYIGGDVEGDEDLRDVFKVCRTNVFVCDRDAGPDTPPPKPGVARVQQLLGADQVWVTSGYEIEWYYPRAVAKKLWPKLDVGKLYDADEAYGVPFYPALRRCAEEAESAGKRKTHFARRAVTIPRDEAKWFAGTVGAELETSVGRVADIVRAANELSKEDATVCKTCGQAIARSGD